VKVGEEVEIVGLGETRKTVATGVEMFRKLLDEGRAGDNVGVLLRGIAKEEVERGRCWRNRSIKPHTKFKAEAYILTKEKAADIRRVSRVASAVLFQDYGRDRGGAVT